MRTIGFSNTIITTENKNLYEPSVIKTDKNNNIYIACKFKGTLAFDSINISLSANISPISGEGISIAKLDANKKLIWFRKVAETDTLSVFDFIVDSFNNYYFAITYTGRIFYDQDSALSIGNADIKLIKFDSNGSPSYTKNIGGIENDIVVNKCLALDDSNNLYLAMNLNNKWDYATPNNYNIAIDSTSILLHSADIVLCKFSPNGSVYWLKRYGGRGADGSALVFLQINIFI